MSDFNDDALTTDDLARPQDRGPAGAKRQPDRPAPENGPPTFPGEATGREDTDREDTATVPPETTPLVEDTGPAATGPVDETEPVTKPATTEGRGPEESEPLLGPGETADLRTRWGKIQNDFVDDPQDAVRAADALVAEVMQTLAGTFAQHKQGLEEQWQKGGEVATEDLRLALQHYRSFFNRLLST